MESDTNKEKIKPIRNIIILSAGALSLVFMAIGISAYVYLTKLNPTNDTAQSEFSEYDNKTYSIISEDGVVQGFIATKIKSCGELPSDMCLNAYYNVLIKESLSIKTGAVSFSGGVGNKGYLQPIVCDVDITNINVFYKYDTYPPSFNCGTSTSPNLPPKSFYFSSVDVFRNSEQLKQFPPDFIGDIKVYDVSSSPSRIVKKYKVIVQPVN